MKDKDRSDFHLFQTNHPYFIELGLGSFTTGTLIEWWNERDYKGNYLNRRHINIPAGKEDDLSNPSVLLSALLGITDNTEFFWYGWKPNLDIANAGRFVKQNLKGLKFNQGGDDSDLWEYRGNTAANMNDINDTIDKLGLSFSNPIIGVYPSGSEDGTFEAVAIRANSTPFDYPWSGVDADTYYDPLKDLQPVYELIQLNKYMNHFEDFFPRETWNPNDTDTHKPLAKNEAFGSWALLNEIKAAKGNPVIQWSGDVSFYINQNNGLIDNCKITDNIKFNLFLTDESMSKGSNKSVTVKNMTYVGPKRDATGASQGPDGTRESSDQEDVSTHAAGEIDLQWNPVSKKWQSGNVNMLAKLVTNVGPGKAPSLEFLLNNDIQETLEEEDNANCYIPARGSGMPIRTQNSMPLQWSPNYAQTEDTRCSQDENKDKQLLTVYNFNPRKAYPSGEEVLLTYIDNVWHISDLGQGDTDLDVEAVDPEIGKWGPFTYMMTSSQHFFRGISTSGNASVSITPRSAELNFHKKYYFEAAMVNEQGFYDYLYNYVSGNYGVPGNEALGVKPEGGYNFSQPFDTNNHVLWYDEPGYLQTTSFDYLDSQIYGIRGRYGGSSMMGTNPDLCSISSTSATVNSAGQNIPFSADEYPNRNAAHCGAFFGCVFPNGYINTEVYDDPERNFTVSHSGRGEHDLTYALNYFDTTKNTLRNPFEAGDGSGTRNDCCIKNRGAAKSGDPFAPIQWPTGNIWQRGSYQHEANMFYLGADLGRRTIPADVMLNASPSGSWGSPIKPIAAYLPLNSPDNIHISGVANSLQLGVWLHKEQPTGIDPYESAFDFQPNKRDNLMFRPLKLEAYLQYGWPRTLGGEYSDFFSRVDDSVNFTNGVGGGSFKFYSDIPWVFWGEIANSTVSKKYPVSAYVPLREYFNTIANLAGYERSNGDPDLGAPLKWGRWTKHRPTYSRLHEYLYWEPRLDNGGMKWTEYFEREGDPYVQSDNTDSDWRGAGAFGVIATSLKIKANTTLEFVTSNLYGMGAAANGKFTIGGGHASQKKTWGVSNFIDSYKQENITDLSVRIYQSHPSELTLYDPRYVAVHHFNPGVDFVFDKYRMTDNIPVNALSTASGSLSNDYRPRNYSSTVFKNFRNNDGDLLSSVHYVYPESSGVDIRVPSIYAKHVDFEVGDAHEDNTVYHSQRLEGNYLAFADATSDGGPIPLPPLMPEEYWNVETTRNGKLLPYRYQIPSFGSPISPFIDTVAMIDEESIEGQSVYPYARNLIVTNYGNGFASGDAVGNLELDIIMKVVATGENGSVQSLEAISRGSGVQVTNLPSSGARIGEFTPRLEMLPLTGNGQSFRGYFVSAALRTATVIDPKPFLIKRDGNEISRIAANQPGPTHLTTGFSEAAEPGAFITDTQTTEFLLPEILRPSNSEYDLFFHFHNDITFNWYASMSDLEDAGGWGDFNNYTESNEQHVTIEGITLI